MRRACCDNVSERALGIEINQTALDLIENIVNRGIMAMGYIPPQMKSKSILHCGLRYGVTPVSYGGGFGDVSLKWIPEQSALAVNVGHFFGKVGGGFAATA